MSVHLARLRLRFAVVFAGVAVALAVLLGVLALIPWNGTIARAWFAVNHAKFARLSDAAERGGLHPDSGGWFRRSDASWLTLGHSGQDVPMQVARGRALMLGRSDEEVPRGMYLYVYGRADAARLNPCELRPTTFGDYYQCTRLDSGWWWHSRKPDYPAIT